MVYYVDIDETICEYGQKRSYPLAKLIVKNIAKINSLYDEGHTIVYWTARGATTGLDWDVLTKEQLDRWGAKYSEVRMGKPHYDFFICDKAINSMDFFKQCFEVKK